MAMLGNFVDTAERDTLFNAIIKLAAQRKKCRDIQAQIANLQQEYYAADDNADHLQDDVDNLLRAFVHND